jgi:hypothetical protein
VPWLDYAKLQWGSHFSGVYLNDEPGGTWIDINWKGYFDQIRIQDSPEYSLHAPAINLVLNGTLPIDNNTSAYEVINYVKNDLGLNQLQTRSINSFTSDYALYWWDYLGGYDTVFTEFGSNQSVTQAIAFDRGAARMQNKTWGVIITWTYNQPPYIENATEMYNQLVDAYIAGAKYEIIFDYPQIQDNPYGILTNDHFTELEKFWNNIQTLKVIDAPEAALVLPHNYGWAMRNNQTDPIWGIWSPNSTSTQNTSEQIWTISRKLLSEYGLNLDIVYEDSLFPLQGKYQQVYYYNQTN